MQRLRRDFVFELRVWLQFAMRQRVARQETQLFFTQAEIFWAEVILFAKFAAA